MITILIVVHVETWPRQTISNEEIYRIFLACKCLDVNDTHHIWYLAVRAYGEERGSPQKSAKKKKRVEVITGIGLGISCLIDY